MIWAVFYKNNPWELRVYLSDNLTKIKVATMTFNSAASFSDKSGYRWELTWSNVKYKLQRFATVQFPGSVVSYVVGKCETE